MRCAWQELLSIIPSWMRQDVDELGRDTLQELRLRIGLPPELIRSSGNFRLKQDAVADDLNHIVSAASKYSPWSAASAAQGYLTAPGGHRIGLCGDVVVQNGRMTGFRYVTSLCIRVARDFPGIADELAQQCGSILILGRPGSGKTTLLRDLIRRRSEAGEGSIAVVDERGEIFPRFGDSSGFAMGCRTDVLTGCSKGQGIEAALRTMGPETIAVDEITSQEDCTALITAGWCGVRLIATAHAASADDLRSRPVYKPLAKSGLFNTLVILQPDKSWKAERMAL